MALKTSNKNRKKVEQQKIEQIQHESIEFERKFTRYYVIAFVVLFAFFTIL
jgi:hypothetical protein